MALARGHSGLRNCSALWTQNALTREARPKRAPCHILLRTPDLVNVGTGNVSLAISCKIRCRVGVNGAEHLDPPFLMYWDDVLGFREHVLAGVKVKQLATVLRRRLFAPPANASSSVQDQGPGYSK